MRVVCVGAGPAGLYLSILMKLDDPGHDIVIFERGKGNLPSGWGVTMGPGLVGLLTARDPVSAQRVRDAAYVCRDQVIHIRGEKVVAPGTEVFNITRSGLLDILADRARELGVRIEYDHEVSDLSQLPEADLIVAADGVSSRIRREVGTFSTSESEGANRYIWLGTTKVFEEFNYLFVPTPSGWIWAHAYGIDETTSTFIPECTAETWAGLGFDSMSADDALVALEDLFREHLGGHGLMGNLADGTEARWLIFRNISNDRWHDGKVVLAGDSAHTAHFSIGMGTTLAIQDSVVLADSLHRHSDIETALAAYEAQRKAELVPVLAEGRCSASWLENISRYIARKPGQFADLFYARRSPLIASLPPAVSVLLRRLAGRVGVLDGVRHRVAPMVKVVYARTRA